MNKQERIVELKKQIDKYNKEIDEEMSLNQGFPPEDEVPEHLLYGSQNRIECLYEQKDELELELRELEYSEEEKLRRKEVKELIYGDGYIIHDGESEKDFLSRADHAKEISKLISNRKTLTPLTLGIYGPWGEGKSSFLKLIETELDELNINIKNDKNIKYQYNKTHIVRFNASEYNDQDKIWFSMLSQIFAKYEKELLITAKLRYGYTMLKKSFRENILNYAINFILLILFLAWILIYIKDKSIVEVIRDNPLFANLLGIVSTVTVATNIVLPIFKKIKFLTKPMSDKIISQLKYPDYKELLGTREKVKESLDVLVEAWIRKRGDKIVVMVDELDRCSERTIIEFFEALQLFLPVESIIHVISINQEAVCFSLANNNLHFFDKEVVPNEEKMKFGKEYLEKYITIPYHLPSANNYKNYITNILTVSLGNENVDLFSNSEKEFFIKIVTNINQYKHITPREMKKIINLLLLSRERLININKTKEHGSIIKFEEFINWFLIKYFYPKLTEEIANYIMENYNKHKYKVFKQIERQLFLNKKFEDSVELNQLKALLKYLDNTRIEYIIISNRVSQSFIV
ncbi:KAP family P-loop NTPase fold protein [Metabacillus fastidiosus]|uniref:KAP family P-loop NTPase fold protein n=1 Tax=Metabacillus fastidiosus TaxID=1458 RepID=UPI003D2A920F